jgi:hypothetical protein
VARAQGPIEQVARQHVAEHPQSAGFVAGIGASSELGQAARRPGALRRATAAAPSRRGDEAVSAAAVRDHLMALLPFSSKSMLPLRPPCAVPFTADVVSANVSVEWAMASDIWSRASSLRLLVVSQAWW